MSTKQIINTLLAILLGLQLTGCSLDETLYGIPNPEIIKDKDDVEVLVKGLYGQLNPYTFKLYLYYMITTDDMVFLGNNLTAESVATANRTYDATNTRNALLWNTMFSTVGSANYLLDFIESKKDIMGEDSLKEAKGQSLFMRAYIYYYLVRLYGGLPIRTKSFELEDEKFLKRAPVDSVYQLIFNDLKEASLLLSPNTASTLQGKATKGAAQGILASASLTYANYLDYTNTGDKNKYYQQAKDYADSVIVSGTYSLVDDFAQLWDVNSEAKNYQTEVIFGIQFTRDPFNSSRTSMGSHFTREYNPVWSAFGQKTVGWYPVQPYIYDIYNSGDYAGDYRTQVSFTTDWVRVDNKKHYYAYPREIPAGEQSGTYAYIAKYKDAVASEFNAENDMFVLRLAEMYMIYAEAENELNGPTQAAYQAFNKIRERARKADGTSSTAPKNLADGLTKEEFRMAVFWERGLEFLAEDLKRYFDLVRMKAPNGDVMYMYQIEEFLPSIPTGKPTWNNVQKKWLGGRKVNEPFQFFTRKNLLLPIPKPHLDANPNFGDQNPGW